MVDTTNVKKVILNVMTTADYQALVASGQVSPTELYMTTDDVYATQQWVQNQGYIQNAGTFYWGE